MSQEQLPAQNGAIAPAAALSDDEVLAFTRGVRVKVVNVLMTPASPGAPAIPQDTGERIFLTNMLNGLDSQAMGSKKLAADERNADNTAAVVAELLRTMNKNTAFQGTPAPGQIIDVDAHVVPHSIGDMPALPGEMDVAPPQLDYASFVRSQGRDVDQIGKDVKHEEAYEDPDTP